MKLKAVFTEKSMSEAKKGIYTFWVNPLWTKEKIKVVLKEVFGVKVTRVRTINLPKLSRRTMSGKRVTTMARKKAMVTLAPKEKIDLFEEAAKEAKK